MCSCQVSRLTFWVHEAELRPWDECEVGTVLPEAGADTRGWDHPVGTDLESAPAKFPFPSLIPSLFRFLFQFTTVDIDMLKPAT